MQDGPEARAQAHAKTLERVPDPNPVEGAVQGAECGSEHPAIEVVVNGSSRSLPPGCTVEGMVDALGLDWRRIAVAVNRDVVPRSTFGARVLVADDHVEILEAVGGG